ncbi:MAG: hypothetical protein EZS28_001777, partial [Streblomastix strix]
MLASSLIIGFFEVHATVYYVSSSSVYQDYCSLARPCRTLNDSAYAISYMNSNSEHIVNILNNPLINTSAICNTAQYNPRHFQKDTDHAASYYPSILFAYIGQFVCQKGTLQFSQINFKLEAGESKMPFCISGVASTAKIVFKDCRSSMETPGTISTRGLIEMNNSANLTFDYTSTNYYFHALVISLERRPLMQFDNNAGSITIRNAAFENVTRQYGNGGAIYVELSQSMQGLVFNNVTFKYCTVNTTNNNLGGGIYIKGNAAYKSSCTFQISSEGYKSHYIGCEARYGKGIFIETNDFTSYVTNSSSDGLKQVGNLPDTLDEREMMG